MTESGFKILPDENPPKKLPSGSNNSMFLAKLQSVQMSEAYIINKLTIKNNTKLGFMRKKEKDFKIFF